MCRIHNKLFRIIIRDTTAHLFIYSNFFRSFPERKDANVVGAHRNPLGKYELDDVTRLFGQSSVKSCPPGPTEAVKGATIMWLFGVVHDREIWLLWRRIKSGETRYL